MQISFLTLFLDMEADGFSPFLPGVPNQKKYDGLLKHCHFKVLQETETKICIAGTPIRRKDATNYRELKLLLKKNPWRLSATQYIHPGGNQSSVYVFSNIEMNPVEWDDPDLTRYEKLSRITLDYPVEACKPVDETSQIDTLRNNWIMYLFLNLFFKLS